MANRLLLKRMQTNLLVCAELLSGTKSRSLFKNEISQREDRGVSFVDERAKDLLWETLMSHFTLPEHLTDAEWEKVKKSALKKMVTQFYNHKKRIWKCYEDAGKQTPKFTGALEKAKDHWDLFVEFKESEAAMERSRINKINAEKKSFTIFWGQVATRLAGLSGMNLRKR